MQPEQPEITILEGLKIEKQRDSNSTEEDLTNPTQEQDNIEITQIDTIKTDRRAYYRQFKNYQRMKKQIEQKDGQHADLLVDNSRMKHTLKGIKNFKNKYQIEKTENQKLDDKLRN